MACSKVYYGRDLRYERSLIVVKEEGDVGERESLSVGSQKPDICRSFPLSPPSPCAARLIIKM